MTVRKKIVSLLAVDLLLMVSSIYLSYWIRFDGRLPAHYAGQFLTFSLSSVLLCMLAMWSFRLYGRIWRYAGVGELLDLLVAVLLGYALSFGIHFGFRESVPLSVLLLSLGWRIFFRGRFAERPTHKRALIIGAGDCGIMVAGKLRGSPEANTVPVAFVDDDPSKWKLRVSGIPVVGGRQAIPDTVKRQGIDELIIAMPSVSRREIGELIDVCKQTRASLKIIPRIDDLISGKVSVPQIRDVEVEDLLGRDPVHTDLEAIAHYVRGKVVLITGAGGSIGSELCRQISPFEPKLLLLVGHGENSIYGVESELKSKFPHIRTEPVIADIQDLRRMEGLFKRYAPQVVFHAAAHKHVPLMESNPSEAVKNNVLGTKNVADCADRFAAERFVLISTDKAVNPTSVMGATKRVAEMYIQSLGTHSRTKFVAVRFGNVLGSRGSVIPRFKEQIAAGGPVTVTHPDMIRYFMTIPEAVQLVIQAGSFASGGEVFILDMGEPVRILELAEDLIRLSGFVPYEEMDIRVTGIRPGEKLFEELLTSEEGLTQTVHDRIFIAKPSSINRTEMEFSIKKLEKALGEDKSQITERLKHIVPTFQNVS
jgi:FlaA1/EpsC-like NDP-sugar epimerase